MFQIAVDSCVFLGTIVHCSIAASCSLLASRTYISEQFTEKLELGWGLSADKEEAGLICCRALPAQGGVTSLSVEANAKVFLAEII